MVTLVWGGGEGVLGEGPPPLVFNYSKEALGVAPPCGDTWVCHVVIAVKRIAQAAACTAKKRSRLITNRNDRS